MSELKKSSRGRLPDGAPNPIDKHVGNMIRLRRQMLGISQENLASQLGIAFQQVQKYERGMNRVSASRLWDLSKVLEVPINFFYEDMDKSTIMSSPRGLTTHTNSTEEHILTETDPLHRRETIELVKAYYKIPNREAARHMFDLITILSKSPE